MHIILENIPSAESRAVRLAGMLNDNIRVTNSSFEGLQEHRDSLNAGAIPVGSVQFLRQAMKLAGATEPTNSSYPSGCEPYTRRNILRSTAERALSMTGARFIKSEQTKVVTGFVLDSDSGSLGLNDHDRVQFNRLCALPASAPVWVSEVVEWVSEFRYYVMDSQILGRGRYDQDDLDLVPEPDTETVQRCIVDVAIPHPYALDMGVLSSGQTALVEVNDAWAIGLYAGDMKPYVYVEFLANRWKSIWRAA